MLVAIKTTQITKSLPEKQHDGKWFVERCRKDHTQLDGLLQMLLGNVEAVVVDLAAPEDVLMHRALLQNRRHGQLLSFNTALYCSDNKRQEEKSTYLSWWSLQLNVYWLNKGANRDLSPRAALVQTQIDHWSTQLEISGGK